MADYKVRVKDCAAEQCGYRCQEVCPQGVFLAVPRDRKMERHAANPCYRIVPRFVYFCDGCGECLPACPQDAIRVSLRKTGEKLKQPVGPG